MAFRIAVFAVPGMYYFTILLQTCDNCTPHPLFGRLMLMCNLVQINKILAAEFARGNSYVMVGKTQALFEQITIGHSHTFDGSLSLVYGFVFAHGFAE
jgi:hypothetical protein